MTKTDKAERTNPWHLRLTTDLNKLFNWNKTFYGIKQLACNLQMCLQNILVKQVPILHIELAILWLNV